MSDIIWQWNIKMFWDLCALEVDRVRKAGGRSQRQRHGVVAHHRLWTDVREWRARGGGGGEGGGAQWSHWYPICLATPPPPPLFPLLPISLTHSPFLVADQALRLETLTLSGFYYQPRPSLQSGCLTNHNRGRYGLDIGAGPVTGARVFAEEIACRGELSVIHGCVCVCGGGGVKMTIQSERYGRT